MGNNIEIEVVDNFYKVRYARIDECIAFVKSDFVYIAHSESNGSREPRTSHNIGGVETVGSLKGLVVATYAEAVGKPGDATSAVATHCSSATVGIEIEHFEIGTQTAAKKHHAIGTDAATTVANSRNGSTVGQKMAVASVEYDEVVTGAFVFFEFWLQIVYEKAFVQAANINKVLLFLYCAPKIDFLR